MARPVTLFTGQWADLPFETVAEKAAQFGYDGIELPCWGDHFDVSQATGSNADAYCRSRHETLAKHGLKSRMEEAYTAEMAELPPKVSQAA